MSQLTFKNAQAIFYHYLKPINAVCAFKHGFWPTGIGIRQCAAFWHHVYAKMCQLTNFWEHGIGYLTKKIESFNDCIEHDNEMLVSIKVLYIAFAFLFTTEFEVFMLVKLTNQLTIHRLLYNKVQISSLLLSQLVCHSGKGNCLVKRRNATSSDK